MKRQNVGIIVLIVLLGISLSPTLHNNDVEIDYNIVDSTLSSPSFENILSKKPYETIIFFDSIVEFQEFTQFHNIIRGYPNLMAVRVMISDFELQNYQDIRAYPAVYFEKFQTSSLSETNNKISPQHEAGDSSVVELVHIENLWDLGFNGTNINVAIIDNGIEASHPALLDKVVHVEHFGLDPQGACADHGTNVAGALAADADPLDNHTAGTGFGVNLFDVSLDCDGFGGIEGDILGAFEYILSNGTIDVVNTSFGGNIPAWDSILRQLESANIIVVGSAGNGGLVKHSTQAGGPGNSLHGISVGAVELNGEISIITSVGPAHNMLVKPDVLAPGWQINTTNVNGGYNLEDGTSFSSPIVAGGISTILSWLNSNGTLWNAGLIKAALMRSATWYDEGELLTGQGLVNFTNMYELIDSLSLGGDTIAQIVELTPKIGPIHFLETIPQGVTASIPMTLISSHPTDVTFSYSGNISSYLSVDSLDTSYSQQILVDFNTTSLNPGDLLTGNITAMLGSDSVSAKIEITIGETVHSTIGLDLGHSYFDQIGYNGVGGSNTGEFVKLAMKNGYWVETIIEEINSTVLSNYDIFWMPDPVNYIYDSGTSGLIDRFELPLMNTEITAIVDFVENGGSLLINSIGKRNESDFYSDEIPIGLNASGINLLTSNFGITYETEPIPDPKGSVTLNLINESSAVSDAAKMTHFGNYLNIQDPARAIAKTNGGLISTAIYNDPNGGGRVIVSSSDRWLDNTGILGNYVALQNNPKLALNALDWLVSNTHVIKTSEIITNGVLTGTFEVYINGALTNSDPNVYVYDEIAKTSTPLSETNLGTGEYSVQYTLPSSGHIRIVAEVGDDYVAWVILQDIIPPTIEIKSANPNGTVFPVDTNYLISFTLTDDSSGINFDSLIVTLDEEVLPPSSTVYTEATGSLTLSIRHDDLPHEPDGSYYKIHIVVEDVTGNSAMLDYYFGIGEITGPSSSSTPPSSPTNGGSGGSGGFDFDLGTTINVIAAMIILGYVVTTIYRKTKTPEKST